QVVIEESRTPASPSVEASRLLAAKAREAGAAQFADRGGLERLCARAGFAGITIDVDGGLGALCEGRGSFAQLESADLLTALRPAKLNQLAPERIKLRGGREVKVHYEDGRPPWVESRLQDFFGMHETPRIGGSPVVVHLLAPNRRPVQVTSDLEGFW